MSEDVLEAEVGGGASVEAHEALALDGEARAVSRAWVAVERLGSWIGALVVTAGLVVGLTAWALAGDADGWVFWLAVAGALVVAGLLMAHAQWYPAAAYGRLRYALNDRGIEIRRGVWWRQVVSIPKRRVQHTDVQQGPLMRHFGIAKLVIHTAGTQHAKVELAGLEHGLAVRVRDHLIGRGVGRSEEASAGEAAREAPVGGGADG